MTAVDTAALRRLLAEATPRPWNGPDVPRWTDEDKELVLAAVNVLPDLLDRIEELEAVAEAAGTLRQAGKTPYKSFAHELRALDDALAALDEGEK